MRHYFEADFISQYEQEAAANPITTDRARTLLDALRDSPLRTAAEWSAALQVGSDWVGRGIKKGPQDAQILGSLATGHLTMPLWGASFDPAVARSYGDRFTFSLQGPFPAIPAWVQSGVVAEELELICGGRYQVLDPVDLEGDNVIVNLRFIELTPVVESASPGGHPQTWRR